MLGTLEGTSDCAGTFLDTLTPHPIAFALDLMALDREDVEIVDLSDECDDLADDLADDFAKRGASGGWQKHNRICSLLNGEAKSR